MGTEIERKFLLKDDSWRQQAGPGIPFRQGYLAGNERISIRVRVEGEQANINIKGATLGVRRQEFEYPIPLSEAEELLATLCARPLIEKRRYHLQYADHLWEIDCFEGENAGLVVAEVELADEAEPLVLPPWVGREVSAERRYYNVCLVEHPYSRWSDDER